MAKIHHREPSDRTRCGIRGKNAQREIDWKKVTCRNCIRAERAALSLDGDRVGTKMMDDLLLEDLLLADANSWYSGYQLEGMEA